jgi:DNA-binding FrmR family transcriptional regulator
MEGHTQDMTAPDRSQYLERLVRLEGRMEALEKARDQAAAFRRNLMIAIVSVGITSVVGVILHFT